MEVDVNQLRTQWADEFPGGSATVQTLRESLVMADYLAQESQQAIVDLQCLLAPLDEPMYRWPAPLWRFYNALKRQHAGDVRLRNRVLRDLRSAQPAVKTVPVIEKEARKVSPFSVKIGPKEGSFMQDVHVSVVDGKTISKFDVGRDHWLKERPDDICDSWIRHYWFKNAEVPAEYAFVLEHDGLHYPPGESIFITYPAAEFIRICQQEEDTNSEHALDGERWRYQRLDKAKPIERFRNEDECQDEKAIDPA